MASAKKAAPASRKSAAPAKKAAPAPAKKAAPTKKAAPAPAKKAAPAAKATPAAKGKAKGGRDVEKAYPLPKFIEKLRRLADALEQGKTFRIQVAGERITIPANAIINIEHEREKDGEEVEFQLKWKN